MIMDSMYFTEEHQLFRQSLKNFLQKEVVPHIEKWEKSGTIDRFIWEKMGEMGYFGLATPEAYDGLDLEAMKGVNRFEVIDKSGRAYVKYLKNDERVKYGLQDDDCTLKVFIQDNLEY